MKPNVLAPALLMFCSALATGCGDKRTATAIKTPPERLACEGLPAARPTIPAEYVIDWAHVGAAASAGEAVRRAKVEHQKFVASIRTREGVTVAYILQIEGRLFVCSNNMQWRREFEAKLPDG